MPVINIVCVFLFIELKLFIECGINLFIHHSLHHFAEEAHPEGVAQHECNQQWNADYVPDCVVQLHFVEFGNLNFQLPFGRVIFIQDLSALVWFVAKAFTDIIE